MTNRPLIRILTACTLGLPLAACIVPGPYDTPQPDYSGQPVYQPAPPVYQPAPPVQYEPPQEVEYVVVEPPPPLPVYEQPFCPGPGFIWIPGYWNYSQGGGYYWVPGTWALPPQPNLYWTPAYWADTGGGFRFHQGYWGLHVGYYGGVRYGHGYEGSGYEGGRWSNNEFVYNAAVNNIDITVIRNTYNRPVISNGPPNRSSYGDWGGQRARFTPDEDAAEHERHYRPTRDQAQHQDTASGDHGSYASANRGRPPIAATPRPGVFGGASGWVGHGPDPRTEVDDRDGGRGSIRRDERSPQVWQQQPDRSRQPGQPMDQQREQQDWRARQQEQQRQLQQQQQQEQQRQFQQQQEQQRQAQQQLQQQQFQQREQQLRQQEAQQQILQQRQQQVQQQRQSEQPAPSSNRQWVQQRMQQQQMQQQQMQQQQMQQQQMQQQQMQQQQPRQMREPQPQAPQRQWSPPTPERGSQAPNEAQRGRRPDQPERGERSGPRGGE